MRQKRWFNIVLIFAIALLVAGCSSAAAAPQALEPETPPVAVEVGQVETGNIAATYAYAGDLQPLHTLSLVSIVSGAVEEVMVEVGDEVRAGDPIIRVEDTAYKAQLKQAEAALTVAQTNLLKMRKGPRAEQIEIARASLDGARAQLLGATTMTEDERTLAAANLAQAEAALRLAQYDYDKIKWAGQVSQTPQALKLQQATIAYETASAAYNMQANPDDTSIEQIRLGLKKAELSLKLTENPFTDEDFALARAGVSQAEGVVALAQFQVDNTILRAPFDGVVAEVYVTTGSIASPQSPVIKLISRELEVQIEAPENQISYLYNTQPAALKVAAFPGQDFPAMIASVAPAADATSHTFPVKITPLDEESQLRAGMFAEITVLLEEKTGVTLVPRSAVTTFEGQDVVYVVSADEQTVSRRPVTIGLSDGDRLEITSGLSAGDVVALAGLSNLTDGSRITISARTEQ